MGRRSPLPELPACPGDLPDGDRTSARPGGEGVLFEAFALEQIKRVPELARRMRRPEHLVRDWLDEGLARLWAQEPPIQPAMRDRWLTTTVYRLHVDDLRARRRAELHRPEMIADVEARQAEATPERAVLDSECERLFEALVTTLEPREREVFLLHHDQELPLKEIASRFDLDVEAVKYLLWKARRELREAWARERAKERFAATWAALAAASIALLLLVRRLFTPRLPSRSGVLVASAALALVAAGHQAPEHSPHPSPVSELRGAAVKDDPPALAESSAGETPRLGERSSAETPRLGAAGETPRLGERPALRSPLQTVPAAAGPASLQVASAAARRPVPGLARPDPERAEMPTRLLARARASLQSGDRAGARAALAEYKSLYPHNPLRSQYDKLIADAFAP